MCTYYTQKKTNTNTYKCVDMHIIYTLLFLYSADVDYDSDVIDVVFNVGDSRVTVAINITDDGNDEGNEAFGLDLKITDGTPATVRITGLTTAFGIIDDNDEPGKRVCIYVFDYIYVPPIYNLELWF